MGWVHGFIIAMNAHPQRQIPDRRYKQVKYQCYVRETFLKQINIFNQFGAMGLLINIYPYKNVQARLRLCILKNE